MIAEKKETLETTVVMTVQKGGRQLKDVFSEAEPCTLNELCELYSIQRHEMEKRLKPFRTIIGKKINGYNSREQVQKIYLLIGPPDDHQVVPLTAFPHNPESWKAACKTVFRLIQSITRKTH